ncbi:MAG: hypothetical protein U0531_11330 [Dehalococcoidia bacterium]
MKRWLPAAELHHVRLTFELDEAVEHPLHLRHGERKAVLGVGEADRTVEVADAVDLNQAEAGVLLVIGAKAAVMRTTVRHRRAVRQGPYPAC